MKMIKFEYDNAAPTYINPSFICTIDQYHEPTADFPYKIRILNSKGYHLDICGFTSLEEREEAIKDLLKQLEEA